MMFKDRDLYYEIDEWPQICDCISNVSEKLHVTYDVLLGRKISGGIVRVEHDDYGTLFAYLVDGSGDLLEPDSNGVVFELTTDEVLLELHKYGFNVRFSERIRFNRDQYQLLTSASLFGMDKIRLMFVDNGVFDLSKGYDRKARLVLFDASNLSSWLDNQKTCTEKEFVDAIESGYAINVTKATGGIKPGNNWSFLYEHIYNVCDLIRYCV